MRNSAPQGEGVHAQDLVFPWEDAATRSTAFRAAQAQLTVFDTFGVSQRGDLQLRLSGHIAGVDGEPLYVFENVPRLLAQRVVQGLNSELRVANGSTTVLAYRILLLGQEARSLEVQSVYLPRKRHIQRVKSVQVYDHALKRQADSVVHETTLRAIYDADNPKRMHHESTLGSSQMEGLMLHALSAHAQDFYGEAEDADAAVPTLQSRQLFSAFQPKGPVALKPQTGGPVKEKVKEKTVPTAPVKAPVPGPAVPKPVMLPKPSVPGDVLTVPEVQPVLPMSEAPPALDAAPSVVAPPPAAPAPDPWVRLRERVAIDEEVVRLAQSAVERCKPLLLRGAPGTGKTLIATTLAEAICGPGNFTLVTADARWTSADVIGGLRVVAGTGLQYAFSPGVVTRAAARHQASMAASGRPHALIIDEFNRANQDEAFGRLLTLLDSAYRGVMPLVGAEDGAPEQVYLPNDFLLIATMNDADSARLHEIGAALSRRFATVRVGIPSQEETFLSQKLPGEQITVLKELYGFVGRGEHTADLEHGRLRAFIPVGTYFMQEALDMNRQGLALDEALGALIQPLLLGQGQSALTALHLCAQKANLPVLSRMLGEALSQTHF